MTRLRMAFVAAFVAILLSACGKTFSRDPANVCEFVAQRKGWFAAIEKTEANWGVPQSLVLAFIQHESLFDADARPPRKRILWVIPGPRRSTAYGYAQALDATWQAYIKSTGNRGADRDNFADASDFIGWYVTSTTRQTGIPKTDTYRQYLAYHEGAGGYKRGTYNAKKWLLRVARQIESREKRYRSDLAKCTAEQRRPRKWWWPF